MRIFRNWFFRYLLSNYRWYRRWYGGRWERHYIELCHSLIWLDMQPGRKWPNWIPHSSRGTPTIEDYPPAGARS